MTVSAVDWILLAVLAFSMLLGLWRGLVYEVLSVLGWALAFYAAQAFAPRVAALLPIRSASESLRYVAGFVLVFISVVFAAGLLAFLIKKLVTAIGLRPIDRILGAGFGLLRGLILLLAATVVMDMTVLRHSPWWRESEGAALLTATLKSLKPLLPGQFGRYIT